MAPTSSGEKQLLWNTSKASSIKRPILKGKDVSRALSHVEKSFLPLHPPLVFLSPQRLLRVGEWNIVKKLSIEYSHEIYIFKEIDWEECSQGSREVSTGNGVMPIKVFDHSPETQVH